MMFLGFEFRAAGLRFALSLASVGIAAAALPTAAYAQGTGQSIVLTSDALIERTVVGPDGKDQQVQKSPKDVIVVPGDRIIFSLNFVNKGTESANGFRATNPMPAPVQFVSVAEDWAEVSVDGGKSWGKLAELKVAVPGGDGAAPTVRAAASEDVTHVRWVFANAIAPGAKGSVSFRGLIK